MFFKKSISSVISTLLIVVLVVLSSLSFQIWFENYSNNLGINTENKSSLEKLKIISINNNIYINSPIEEKIFYLKITDSFGDERCSYNIIDSNSVHLLSYWDFDYVNSTHIIDNGLFNNSGIFYDLNYVKGIIGNAGNFNGDSSYVEINNLKGINTTRDLSFSLWFKADIYNQNYGNSNSVLFWKQDDEPKFMLSNLSDIVVFTQKHSFSNANSANLDINLIKNNDWNFLVGTINSSNKEIKIYLNDNYSNFYILPSLYNSGNKIRFGKDDASNRLFRGLLDEIKIYNKTLNQNEVRNLYYFNSPILKLNRGINQINIPGCRLKKNNQYSVFISTENYLLEEKIIYR